MLQRLSDDSLPSNLEKRESVGSWGRPSNRHPRDAQIIPKSRDFH
jgi:error-prone DNA polymerase